MEAQRRRLAIWLLGTAVVCFATQARSVAASSEPPALEMEAPRVRSMLEHGWAAESGTGQQRNAALAAYLYCQAARSGSAEAHYRAGRILAAEASGEERRSAAFFLISAVELGHGRAIQVLDEFVRQHGPLLAAAPGCFQGDPYDPPPVLVMAQRDAAAVSERAAEKRSVPLFFDLERYVAALRPERRRVAGLVSQHADEFAIDRRLALAIASVESNFDPMATSPKNAQGVMQLMPQTAKRFKVSDPYDPVQSIRGGLAYLRWLSDYFAGDLVKVIAAYNAGEGAVTRYDGVPPYAETRAYVRRVLDLSGMAARR